MRSDELPALPTGCHLRGGVFHLRVGIPDDIRHLYPRTEAIEIHGRAGTVKTASSARWVPVHAELIRLGLIQYRNCLRDAGEIKLFPTFHRGAASPGDVFGKWFARYRKSIGLPSGALEGSHRFRHLVRSRLAERNVAVETADALTGHAATGSTGRRVYTKIGLKAIADAVSVLAWPMALQRVWEPPSHA